MARGRPLVDTLTSGPVDKEDRRIGGGTDFRSRVSAVGSLVRVFRFGYRFRT